MIGTQTQTLETVYEKKTWVCAKYNKNLFFSISAFFQSIGKEKKGGEKGPIPRNKM